MITANVSFKRAYIYSMGEKYSKFRGKGTLVINKEVVHIRGKRIYSPMLLRGLIVLFLSVLSFILLRSNYLFWPLLFVSYLLVQYVILKNEDISLKWEQIGKFEVDSKKKTIAFSIDNYPSCSPVVLQSRNFLEIASAFRENIPLLFEIPIL